MPDRKKIKKLLIDADLTMSDIAREYQCRPQVVSGVIAGTKQSKRLQAYIEERLGARLGDLFPQAGSGYTA